MIILQKVLNQMQLLAYLEDRFYLLSKKSKIELFLFPLLVLALIYMLLTQEEKIKRDTNFFNVKFNKSFQNKDLDFVTILKDIESFSSKNKILIENISRNETTLNIELSALINKQILFINFLENYNSFSKIENLKIDKKSLNLEVVFQKQFVKEKINLKNRISKLKITANKSTIELNLLAIVGDMVNINNTWIQKFEEINGFKLIKVYPNKVLLESHFGKKWIKLHEDL